ncbi:MAG: S-methyl-5-thioribose-1-phosphate isomerase [Zetaproteobacteria bacterium]|nr:S-methyl-5-thioribose-1-phosphate isomerase [Zetaproteobacteria bacterium]
MRVNGKHHRTVWWENNTLKLIEQNHLPFRFTVYNCEDYRQSCKAIDTMIVRGAGAIGATAAFAMAQAIIENDDDAFILKAKLAIEATRPTAQNLFYATNRVYQAAIDANNRKEAALLCAQAIADEDVRACQTIGELGNLKIIDGMNILTHCNAGWLAFVDYGSALAPIYSAHHSGKKIHVWVDETRPRGQGARLTAWELANEGIPHTIIPDNAGAYYASLGKIDMIIVGADRIAANGDVANKIGTFEKAIVAKTFGIPFYVAAPSSTIDLNCMSGKEIPIEQRSADEVRYQQGLNKKGLLETVLVCNSNSAAENPAFDITPYSYITDIITEKGMFKPAY